LSEVLGDDGYIKIWDLTKDVLSYAFHAHSAKISSITFGFDDQIVISSSLDKTVKLWVAETVIPKPQKPPQKLGFFEKLLGKTQPEPEPVSLPSLPSFVLQKVQEISQKPHQPSGFSQADNEANTYSFQSENSTVPERDPQLSLEDWNRWLKKWKREEEERRKEQRTKERFRLREERLKVERLKEERLRKEQQLREERLKQQSKTTNFQNNNSSSQQKANTNFWDTSSSGSSNGKTYVEGYRRKDGTQVKGHYRNK